MPAHVALATSVGLLAVLDTWLFLSPLAIALPGLVWISFIAWGCHFHSGGGSTGATTAVVCMSWGAIVGMAAVMLTSGPLTGLGQFAAPLAVGLGAALICLSAAIGILQAIPASVYGFASIAGPIVLSGMTPQQAILPVITSIIIGAVFGYMSEMLADVLTGKGAHSAETVTDPDHA